MHRKLLRTLLYWVTLVLLCTASAGAVSKTSLPAATGSTSYLPIMERPSIVISDLAVTAPYLYVAWGTTLTIADVAQPAQARILATLILPQPIRAIAAVASHVYMLTAPPPTVSIPTDAATLFVIDVQTPSAPTIQSQLPLKAYQGSHLVYTDGSLYVAGSVVQQIDVSQPQKPRAIRTVTLEPTPRANAHLVARSGALYVASNYVPSLCCNRRYFERLVSNASETFAMNGQWISSTSYFFRFRGIALMGDRAYVATTGVTQTGQQGGELMAFDLTNPTSLNEGPATQLMSNPVDIQAAGAYLYVCQVDNKVTIFRSGDGGVVSQVGQIALPALPELVRIADGRAYIADVNGNVLIADVTMPEQPVVLGSFVP
jgi:hypothetical protein